jgi:hypothetical protein
MAEFEWIPARLRRVHERGDAVCVDYRKTNPPSRAIVRIRPFDFKEYEVETYRSMGCDAERFFLIHPEDAIKHWHERVLQICEHEVLTD